MIPRRLVKLSFISAGWKNVALGKDIVPALPTQIEACHPDRA